MQGIAHSCESADGKTLGGRVNKADRSHAGHAQALECTQTARHLFQTALCGAAGGGSCVCNSHGQDVGSTTVHSLTGEAVSGGAPGAGSSPGGCWAAAGSCVGHRGADADTCGHAGHSGGQQASLTTAVRGQHSLAHQVAMQNLSFILDSLLRGMLADILSGGRSIGNIDWLQHG